MGNRAAFQPRYDRRTIFLFREDDLFVALALCICLLWDNPDALQYPNRKTIMTHLIAHMAAVISLTLIPTLAAWSQTAGKALDQLGKVDFPNSCSPAVQENFLRGVALLHSFWYSEAEKTFEEVAADDRTCAIAAWGFASILMNNPLAGVGAAPKDALRAQAAIEKGRQMGAKTQRERDYIEAVAA
jgi:hypothetical protein